MEQKFKTLIVVVIKALLSYIFYTAAAGDTMGVSADPLTFWSTFLPAYGFLSYFHFCVKLLGFINGMRIGFAAMMAFNIITIVLLDIDTEVQMQIITPITLCLFIPMCDVPLIFDIISRKKEKEEEEKIPKVHISHDEPSEPEKFDVPKIHMPSGTPEIPEIPKYRTMPEKPEKLLPDGNSPPQEAEVTVYPE